MLYLEDKESVPMTDKFSFSRRFLAGLPGLLFVLGFTADLTAEAPMQKTQAPGYYRMMVGEFEVTALFDGIVQLDAGLLLNVPEKEVRELLDRALMDNLHKIPTSANAYAINTGSKLVLVDTGGGRTFGVELGHSIENLAAAGYRPEQVDAVLITHLHGDHVGGLLNAQGKPAFPNAVVYIAKAEHDFWLSDVEPKAPDKYKEHLRQARRVARSIAEPYLALNRWKTFENGNLPVAGIRAVPIPGHTPGHTAYEIESKGEKFIIIGDTVHIAAVQFARPDAAVSFDSDPKQAAATHKAIFRRIADGKTLIADMHIAFPGIGRMRSDGKKGYAWVPIEYSPLRAKQTGE
jgi:glyoxylase-like metal-dependent hydrolase (beta-lactamase superfamily II)